MHFVILCAVVGAFVLFPEFRTGCNWGWVYCNSCDDWSPDLVGNLMSF